MAPVIKMIQVVKDSETTAARLHAEHDKLARQHTKLQKEFEKLKGDPFDAAAHARYHDKLAAHLQALKKHSAELDEQRRLHREQREAFHAQYEAIAQHSGPTPTKLGRRRSLKP